MEDTKLRVLVENGCETILDTLSSLDQSKDKIDYEMSITKMMLVCKSMMLACKEPTFE